MEIEITINGRKRQCDGEPNKLLLNLGRDELHLTLSRKYIGVDL